MSNDESFLQIGIPFIVIIIILICLIECSFSNYSNQKLNLY